MIQEYSLDLLPQWLRFVEGVVDSEDLPLNVSRETCSKYATDPAVTEEPIRKRILRELSDMAKEDTAAYRKFWDQYGPFLKEGLTVDPDTKEEILPYLRFYSSQSDNELTTLEEYAERMPDEQEEIYYLIGDDVKSIAYSPHLDPLKERGLEVLYLVDPIDPFITSTLTEYEGKKLRNIDDAELNLPGGDTAPLEETADALSEALFNQFVGRCVTTLGDKVVEVRESKVLKSNPVRLVSPADQPGSDLQRVYKYLEQEYQIPKKVFEINRSHPLIINLATLVEKDPSNDLINLSIEQLYENALIVDGLHPNPASVLPRVQQIMEMAAMERAKSFEE